MKVIIGNGTPVEGSELEIDGPVVKVLDKQGRILLAYHLHAGEKVRANTTANGKEMTYEITQ